MKYTRQQDMIASIAFDTHSGSLSLKHTNRRFLMWASIRIGILSLVLALLIAASL